jgi:hypothetical protein
LTLLHDVQNLDDPVNKRFCERFHDANDHTDHFTQKKFRSPLSEDAFFHSSKLFPPPLLRDPPSSASTLGRPIRVLPLLNHRGLHRSFWIPQKVAARPSVVAFTKDGQRLVGFPAKDNKL